MYIGQFLSICEMLSSFFHYRAFSDPFYFSPLFTVSKTPSYYVILLLLTKTSPCIPILGEFLHEAFLSVLLSLAEATDRYLYDS